MAKLIDDVHERIAAEGRDYSHGEDRPLAGYARIMAIYGGAVVGLGALVGARRRPVPERPSAGDLALVALATAKLSRLTTHARARGMLDPGFLRSLPGTALVVGRSVGAAVRDRAAVAVRRRRNHPVRSHSDYESSGMASHH